ncbi:MAG: acetoacetate--CoA ligase [Oleiphilus sp.]|nr:MAG: acetoacetate--CoA ligase [Oleiphilus sp.]
MNTPLWQPDPERIEQSRFREFSDYCKQNHGFSASRSPQALYQDLHTWSVTHPADFWQAVWNYFRVKGDPGPRAHIAAKDIRQHQWFPEARLNFAENLLWQDDAALALIERGENGRREEISYGALKAEVASIASYLAACGVSRGDRVAGFLPNSRYSVVAMLACTSIGAIWSSCSPDFGFQGVLDRFSQIEPTVLFACDGYRYGNKNINTLPRVEQIAQQLSSLKGLVIVPYATGDNSDSTRKNSELTSTWGGIIQQYQGVRLQYEAMGFSDPLYILYSSGTTGQPKCITHSIGGTLLQHLKELGLHTDVRENTRLFYYTTCGWMMWNWLVSGLALGATLVLYDGSPFHPEQSILWDIAEQEAIEVFGASAKYYSACEKYGLTPGQSHNLAALRSLLSTGSPLSHESFEYLYREVKADVCLSSISGGTDIVSCFALGAPVLPVYRGELQCIGLGMDVAFYDENAQALEQGKGELVCRQAFPSMPIGFWNDPDGSKFKAAYFERFDNAWAHGDYGELVPHNDPTQAQHHGVIIHGRSDAVLNPGGVRIGTAEIYRQVEKIDAVFESLAIGQQWQDDIRVVLFVRLQEGIDLTPELTEQIRTTIRANTTPRHVPAKVIAVQDIPRTLSGKLVELAVRNVVHNESVKNREALANPEALELFRNLPELQS